MPIGVLLCDDHAVVRAGLRAFLESSGEFEVLAEVSDGGAAVKLSEELVPDVVLMDLNLKNTATSGAPDGNGDPGVPDGVEATRRIRAASPRTQVVVLTSFSDDSYVFPALRAGAISYMLKSSSPGEIADAVRSAARGEARLHPAVAKRVVDEFRAGKADTPNPFVHLSDREMEVLRLIAEGLSNAEIADRLFISEKTVKGHVSNILGKLYLSDRTQAAVYAWREGLMGR
jgi:NarL family two-component system response regulator LiaR